MEILGCFAKDKAFDDGWHAQNCLGVILSVYNPTLP